LDSCQHAAFERICAFLAILGVEALRSISASKGAHAIIHGTDDPCAFPAARCVGANASRQAGARNGSVSVAGGQAGMKRGFHNDRMTKIAVIMSKPADLKLDFIHLRWRESTTIAAI